MDERPGSKRLAVVLAGFAVALGLATAALAHGGHEHEAKGTIEAIEATKLTLRSTDDKTLELAIDDSTKFVRGKSAVKREDVVVGERAIVKYHEMDGKQHVMEVKLAEKKP